MSVVRRDVPPRSAPTGMPPKRATVIAQRIVKEIKDRNLQPGSHLPPERDMLETYNVGRNTLREALRVLELQPLTAGVLQLRVLCQHGTYVKEWISGDEDRTSPSLAKLLGVSCTCRVLDVEVPYQQHVFPMIPTGMTVNDVIKE